MLIACLGLQWLGAVIVHRERPLCAVPGRPLHMEDPNKSAILIDIPDLQ